LAKEKADEINDKIKRESKFRGDSVDEHQAIEDADLYLSEGEITQQNNNL
jgi:hypothetical protein